MTKHFSSRWLFTTGRLAPEYDYFHCVVNIPEDIQRVGDSEDGEQMSVMTTGAIGKMYGAATTLVGKDEMNGRVNPALEADDDLPDEECREIGAAARGSSSAEKGGGSDMRGRMAPASMDTMRGMQQGNTAF